MFKKLSASHLFDVSQVSA